MSQTQFWKDKIRYEQKIDASKIQLSKDKFQCKVPAKSAHQRSNFEKHVNIVNSPKSKATKQKWM